MSGWRKCDTCRKVRSTEEFDGGAPTCRDCLTAPAPAPRKRAASTVTTTRRAPAAPAAEPSGPRAPRTGVVGSGDLEVRERRARRKAQEQLADSHPEEFALLLRDARAAEGLRPLSTGSTGGAAEAAAEPATPEPAGPETSGS